MIVGATADQVRWVGSIGGDPGVIVVAQDSPFQSLNDLVDAVKADPASVAFAGGSAVGGFDHLKVLMMLDKAGFEDMRAVKYIGLDGGADAITPDRGRLCAGDDGRSVRDHRLHPLGRRAPHRGPVGERVSGL